MSITAAQVKELRELTGAGMMDCKAALDRDQRRHGSRRRLAAQEGHLQGRQEGRPHRGRRPDRRRFRRCARRRSSRSIPRPTSSPATRRSRRSCATSPRWRWPIGGTTEAVAAAKYPGSDKSVTDAIKDAVGTIGENLSFRRSAKLAVGRARSRPMSTTRSPTASASSACWWRSRRPATREAARAFARQVAMHVAATNPLALTAGRGRSGRGRARDARSSPTRRASPASRKRSSRRWSRAACASSTRRSCC